MWQVVPTEMSPNHPFRSDFFPRKFRYKRDAIRLLAEMLRHGCKGRIEQC